MAWVDYMPGNNDRRQVLALIFAVIAIVFLILSFVMPWWWIHRESESFSIHGSTKTISKSDALVSLSWGTSFGGGGARSINGESNTASLIGFTTMFLILALIYASLMITVIFLIWLKKLINPKLPLILGILAMIFCLLAPILFMIALPGALKADAEQSHEDRDLEYKAPTHDDPTNSFFGSYEGTDQGYYITKTRQLWGGDIGWIFAFISFFSLVFSVVNLGLPKRTKYSPSQPLPPQQYTSRPPPPSPPPPRQRPKQYQSYEQEEVSWNDY